MQQVAGLTSQQDEERGEEEAAEPGGRRRGDARGRGRRRRSGRRGEKESWWGSIIHKSKKGKSPINSSPRRATGCGAHQSAGRGARRGRGETAATGLRTAPQRGEEEAAEPGVEDGATLGDAEGGGARGDVGDKERRRLVWGPRSLFGEKFQNTDLGLRSGFFFLSIRVALSIYILFINYLLSNQQVKSITRSYCTQ